MNIQKNEQTNSLENRDFWDSLQMDILTSNQRLTSENYLTFIERSFMFSILFRGCSPLETACFQEILGIKENAYVILLELSEQNKSNINASSIDEIVLHDLIKKSIPDKCNAIGPLNSNRVIVLISSDSVITDHDHKIESISISGDLVNALETSFNVSVKVGIGSIQSIKSIYNSYLDSLSCMYYTVPNHITHYLDLKELPSHNSLDFLETERYLIEAIRLRKTEAYDYFGIIMNFIKPLSDDAKRNKILELLVLTNYTMMIDSQNDSKTINYAGYVNDFMKLEGEQLIEFAFQSFIYITSYVKPQTTIDYTNHIVTTTKEYLENHYAEDISLEDMAAQVNISPQYFSKLIKKTTGFNFIDWLSMLRVKKAKELLTDSSLTVKEVCFMVGYKDPNYFSRIFKKRIGITPSEYVKTSSYLNNKS